MTTQKDIKQMFQQREAVYKTATNHIFNHLDTMFDGLQQIIKQNHNPNQPEVDWHDVLYKETEHNPDGIIVVFGCIYFSEGTQLTLPSGEQITVTDEQQDYFTYPLKIMIPYDIAVEGSVEDVVIYVQQLLEQQKMAIQQYMDEQQSDTSDPLPEESLQGFNLDDLSDEQKQNLIINNPIKN